MEKARIRVAIDPFKVLDKVAEKIEKELKGEKVISIDYDEEADILYVQFKQEEGVDNKSLDDEGYVIGKLNREGEIIGLTILDAKTFEKAK